MTIEVFDFERQMLKERLPNCSKVVVDCKPIFNIDIQNGKVIMEWKEFNRLIKSI